MEDWDACFITVGVFAILDPASYSITIKPVGEDHAIKLHDGVAVADKVNLD